MNNHEDYKKLNSFEDTHLKVIKVVIKDGNRRN